MTKEQAEKRIIKLRKEIDFHRYNYHVLDKETLDPAVLDDLKNELFKLENDYPDLITPDSPTQRVAGEVSKKFKKSIHSIPMISLFDAFCEGDMIDWEERNSNYLGRKFSLPYYCELKLDGLAVNLRYESGLLTLGATRGNGKVGENITTNAKTINSLPLRIRRPSVEELLAIDMSDDNISDLYNLIDNGVIEVRGESVISSKNFNKINAKNKSLGKALLANPRNAVAGSLRQLNSQITANRNLDFYAYDIIFTNNGKVLKRGEIVTRRDIADKLARLLGFKTLNDNCICENMKDIFAFYKSVEQKRSKLVMEIDGVVIKVNDLKMWETLGVVGKAPRYMMAYKFSAEKAATKLLKVVWQVGRTGALTPIAILEPVKVGGAMISHSTLHNLDEIRRLGAKIGDTIIVERSGDVIPKIVQVLKDLRSGEEEDIPIPLICPICGSKIERTNDEVALRCLNKNCYAVNLRKISHFVSKNALDFDGVGPRLIEQFLDVGLIKDPADLYILERPDLLSLARFGEKKADNVIKIIKNKKKVNLARFIFALGIRHVGAETAEMLANTYRDNGGLEQGVSISKLILFFADIAAEEFLELPDIGPIVAESIYEYFHDESNLSYLEKLEDRGVEVYFDKPKDITNQNKDIIDKLFVLTGSLTSLTRGQAKDKITALGGRVKESISQDVDFVVAGVDPGSKYEKALKLGIKVLTEEEFLNLFNNEIN